MAKAKTQYEVRGPKGELLDTRTSTSCRIYTHAIAVRRNERYYRDMATVWTKTNQSNAEWSWNNAKKIVAAGQDDVYGPRGLERAKEILDHGSLANFATAELAKRISDHEERVLDGDFQRLEVITYCGRPDLAQKEHFKAAKQPWYDTVMTLEVTRIK